ncbi:hypothetical protein Ccrd_025117 [Cynara cardunculus var. scolymus]|uniref:BHLH domain-containing protein n=1 Tax=Cynara cardunculus var. scolymus TaxID=59895 RepID=A0A103XBC5_CYNCS|nr:hypothetical protein Ccrd_025117 [Cynara cardunculus var. scolymus]
MEEATIDSPARSYDRLTCTKLRSMLPCNYVRSYDRKRAQIVFRPPAPAAALLPSPENQLFLTQLTAVACVRVGLKPATYRSDCKGRRNKRKKLNDRLFALRAVVPNISKVGLAREFKAENKKVREEMSIERLRYLEATAIYYEAIGMVEDYQQAVLVANLGGIRETHGLHSNLGLKNSPQTKRQIRTVCSSQEIVALLLSPLQTPCN